MRNLAAISTISILMLGLAGGNQAHAQKKPLIVGLAIAQSGWMSVYDEDPSHGAEIAVDEINAAGGVLGRPLKLVYSDTKTDPAQSLRAGLEVLKAGAEFMVASCDFDFGSPAAIEANKVGVASMSICSSSPKWGPQGAGPLVFTIAYAAQVEGFIMAEWAFKKQGWKTAYMLKDTSISFSRTMCVGFEERWKELAGASNLIGVDTFKNDDPSLAAQITRIKNLPKQPDAIFICTYIPGGVTPIRQLRAAGINVPLLTGTGMDGGFWLKSVPNLSNFYAVAYSSIFGDDPNPKVQDFVAKLTKKFGKPPTTGLAMLGYSVIQAFARAAERAGTTEGRAVADELEKFKDEPLLDGLRTYTKKLHIQTSGKGVIMQITNGKWKSLGYRYANSKPVPFDLLWKQ